MAYNFSIKIVIVLFLGMVSSCEYNIQADRMAELNSVIAFIHESVEYCYDWDNINPSLNEWQSPKETLDRGMGDCEDFCILFMFLVHRDLGWEPEIALVFVNGNVFRGHYVVIHNGAVYDPTNGYISGSVPYRFTEVYRLDYFMAMLYATKGYTQSVKNYYTLDK